MWGGDVDSKVCNRWRLVVGTQSFGAIVFRWTSSCLTFLFLICFVSSVCRSVVGVGASPCTNVCDWLYRSKDLSWSCKQIGKHQESLWVIVRSLIFPLTLFMCQRKKKPLPAPAPRTSSISLPVLPMFRRRAPIQYWVIPVSIVTSLWIGCRKINRSSLTFPSFCLFLFFPFPSVSFLTFPFWSRNWYISFPSSQSGKPLWEQRQQYILQSRPVPFPVVY